MSRRGNRRSNGLGPVLGIAVLAVLIIGLVLFLRTTEREKALAGTSAQIAGTVGRVVTAPVKWGQSFFGGIGAYFGGAQLNAKLKAENQSLLQWRDQARALSERLEAYERLHGIASEPLPEGRTGRVIGEVSGTFSRTALVNLGRKSGIEVNWIVLNQAGLVGRVIAVGETTSRVLLLEDGSSRVPVMGETTRARAMAIGDKTLAPTLAHLNTPSLMRDGERVVTSGDDGIFPRGIAVGQSGIAPDKQWRVRLSSNTVPLDFVRLIPPSNFPKPQDDVTPPPLLSPPVGASTSITQAPAMEGGVMPLAPGAAPIPSAPTPDAIREAQEAKALAKKLQVERDAARAAVARAEAARKLAEERAARTARTGSQANGGTREDRGSQPKTQPRPTKKLDPSAVPIAPSALNPNAPPSKTDPATPAEGPQ
jgi:rod shape-determining protein MreC